MAELHYMQPNWESISSRIARDVGDAIRDMREQRGWKQSDLAIELERTLGKKFNVATVSRLESGSRPTPVTEIYALAEIFDVEVQDVLPVSNPDPLQHLNAKFLRQHELDKAEAELYESKAQVVARSSWNAFKAAAAVDRLREMRDSATFDRGNAERSISILFDQLRAREPHFAQVLVSALEVEDNIAGQWESRVKQAEAAAHQAEANVDFDWLYDDLKPWFIEALVTDLEGRYGPS